MRVSSKIHSKIMYSYHVHWLTALLPVCFCVSGYQQLQHPSLVLFPISCHWTPSLPGESYISPSLLLYVLWEIQRCEISEPSVMSSCQDWSVGHLAIWLSPPAFSLLCCPSLGVYPPSPTAPRAVVPRAFSASLGHTRDACCVTCQDAPSEFLAKLVPHAFHMLLPQEALPWAYTTFCPSQTSACFLSSASSYLFLQLEHETLWRWGCNGLGNIWLMSD